MGATSHDETRHERRATRRAGPEVAAVDDPDLAVAVARLAAEHARTSGRPAARRPLGGVGAADAGLATGDASPLILTRQGRRLLAERAQRLRAALGDPGRDGRGDTDDERAAELRRLSWLVEHAADAEDLPDDPEVVELGETVTVQVTGGAPEQFLIVHPVEAPLDTTRISARSPLARALLGRRVGDEVEVDAPSGTYRCRILAAERTPQPVAPQAGTRRQPTEAAGTVATKPHHRTRDD
jgi:transcription elongation factor GreA